MSNKLQEAIWSSNFEEFEKILQENPKEFESINEYNRDQIYSTLLKNNKFSILDILVDNELIVTDLYEYDSFSNTIFSVLFKDLNDDEASLLFLEKFLSKIDNIEESVKNETLIQVATSQNAKSIFIKKLIDAGCNSNYRDNSENTYLHLIISKFGIKTDLLNEYVQLFLDEGVDVNAENIVKKTPLFTAIESNKLDIIDLLLNNGAQANHQNNKGESIFYECIVNKRNYDILVKLCEFESIDFDKITNSNETILFNFLRNCSEHELKTFEILLDQGADFNQPSFFYEMRTPLTLMPEIPFSFFEKVIDSEKVDINQLDNSGNTLLHLVCNYNLYYDQNKAKELYKKVKFLLSKDIDINATNNEDKTALELALTDNLKDKIVTLLLKSKTE